MPDLHKNKSGNHEFTDKLFDLCDRLHDCVVNHLGYDADASFKVDML